MRSEAVHEETYKGYIIKIMPDDDPQNPREDCENFGTMVCWHDRYYLGDGGGWHNKARNAPDMRQDPENYLRMLAGECRTPVDCDNCTMETVWKILNRHYLILPLYLYDHSGITISTGPFSCPWDSGQVGWVYVSHKKIREEYSVKSVRHCVLDENKKRIKAIDMAEKLIRSEVEVYDAYLTGSVYGYVVEKDGEDIDSCWGYIETEHNIEKCYVLEEARSVVDYHAKKAHEEHLKKLKALIREHAPLKVREKELAQV